MNATGLAFDRAGSLYVSSRYDGTVYRVAQNGTMTSYAEGMGVATGIAFDRSGNLYVGDRSGTIFKIARDRQIFVFATHGAERRGLSPRLRQQRQLVRERAYDVEFRRHLSDRPSRRCHCFYRGLGRPQGLAVDVDDNVYVAASLNGRRGVVKITPERKASLVVSGHNLVGLAFAPGDSAVLATTSGVHHLSWGIEGRSLLPES